MPTKAKAPQSAGHSGAARKNKKGNCRKTNEKPKWEMLQLSALDCKVYSTHSQLPDRADTLPKLTVTQVILLSTL